MRSPLPIPPAFETHEPPRNHANDAYEEVILGGIRTACLSRAAFTRMMLTDCLAARELEQNRPKLVFAVNGHTIALAARDEKFRRAFQRADIVHADGQAGVFASRLLTGSPIPERSATTDFIHDAAKAAVEHDLRFFLLGATEEANEKAARILRETYPGLQIVGRRHGYFSLLDEDDVCDEINLAQPDVIWAGLSVPLEYEFAVRNQGRLKAGWLITCGGCFHYVSGDYVRAPLWMQAAGLEWLHRIWREPRRLFWRYAVTNPLALFYLLTRTNSLPAGLPAPVAVASVRTAA
jgi:N-acetylglucosaminyldiphosphoundecaprenol N-acetyl-beta-D-mannosaminyltransferase